VSPSQPDTRSPHPGCRYNPSTAQYVIDTSIVISSRPVLPPFTPQATPKPSAPVPDPGLWKCSNIDPLWDQVDTNSCNPKWNPNSPKLLSADCSKCQYITGKEYRDSTVCTTSPPVIDCSIGDYNNGQYCNNFWTYTRDGPRQCYYNKDISMCISANLCQVPISDDTYDIPPPLHIATTISPYPLATELDFACICNRGTNDCKTIVLPWTDPNYSSKANLWITKPLYGREGILNAGYRGGKCTTNNTQETKYSTINVCAKNAKDAFIIVNSEKGTVTCNTNDDCNDFATQNNEPPGTYKCYQQTGLKCTTPKNYTQNEVCQADYKYVPEVSFSDFGDMILTNCNMHGPDSIAIHCLNNPTSDKFQLPCVGKPFMDTHNDLHGIYNVPSNISIENMIPPIFIKILPVPDPARIPTAYLANYNCNKITDAQSCKNSLYTMKQFDGTGSSLPEELDKNSLYKCVWGDWDGAISTDDWNTVTANTAPYYKRGIGCGAPRWSYQDSAKGKYVNETKATNKCFSLPTPKDTPGVYNGMSCSGHYIVDQVGNGVQCIYNTDYDVCIPNNFSIQCNTTSSPECRTTKYTVTDYQSQCLGSPITECSNVLFDPSRTLEGAPCMGFETYADGSSAQCVFDSSAGRCTSSLPLYGSELAPVIQQCSPPISRIYLGYSHDASICTSISPTEFNGKPRCLAHFSLSSKKPILYNNEHIDISYTNVTDVSYHFIVKKVSSPLDLPPALLPAEAAASDCQAMYSTASNVTKCNNIVYSMKNYPELSNIYDMNAYYYCISGDPAPGAVGVDTNVCTAAMPTISYEIENTICNNCNWYTPNQSMYNPITHIIQSNVNSKAYLDYDFSQCANVCGTSSECTGFTYGLIYSEGDPTHYSSYCDIFSDNILYTITQGPSTINIISKHTPGYEQFASTFMHYYSKSPNIWVSKDVSHAYYMYDGDENTLGFPLNTGMVCKEEPSVDGSCQAQIETVETSGHLCYQSNIPLGKVGRTHYIGSIPKISTGYNDNGDAGGKPQFGFKRIPFRYGGLTIDATGAIAVHSWPSNQCVIDENVSNPQYTNLKDCEADVKAESDQYKNLNPKDTSDRPYFCHRTLGMSCGPDVTNNHYGSEPNWVLPNHNLCPLPFDKKFRFISQCAVLIDAWWPQLRADGSPAPLPAPTGGSPYTGMGGAGEDGKGVDWCTRDDECEDWCGTGYGDEAQGGFGKWYCHIWDWPDKGLGTCMWSDRATADLGPFNGPFKGYEQYVAGISWETPLVSEGGTIGYGRPYIQTIAPDGEYMNMTFIIPGDNDSACGPGLTCKDVTNYNSVGFETDCTEDSTECKCTYKVDDIQTPSLSKSYANNFTEHTQMRLSGICTRPIFGACHRWSAEEDNVGLCRAGECGPGLECMFSLKTNAFQKGITIETQYWGTPGKWAPKSLLPEGVCLPKTKGIGGFYNEFNIDSLFQYHPPQRETIIASPAPAAESPKRAIIESSYHIMTQAICTNGFGGDSHTYNILTQKCCQGKVNDITSSTQICCGSKIIDSTTSFCCSGQPQSNSLLNVPQNKSFSCIETSMNVQYDDNYGYYYPQVLGRTSWSSSDGSFIRAIVDDKEKWPETSKPQPDPDWGCSRCIPDYYKDPNESIPGPGKGQDYKPETTCAAVCNAAAYPDKPGGKCAWSPYVQQPTHMDSSSCCDCGHK